MAQCQHLGVYGGRCRKAAVTARDVHGDTEAHGHVWWRVALCEQHDTRPKDRRRPVEKPRRAR